MAAPAGTAMHFEPGRELPVGIVRHCTAPIQRRGVGDYAEHDAMAPSSSPHPALDEIALRWRQGFDNAEDASVRDKLQPE